MQWNEREPKEGSAYMDSKPHPYPLTDDDERLPLCPDQADRYEIRIAGHLELHWSEWFEGLAITHPTDGETLLSGPVVDQAALYGLLNKVRDLNLKLISVRPIEPQAPTEAREEVL